MFQFCLRTSIKISTSTFSVESDLMSFSERDWIGKPPGGITMNYSQATFSKQVLPVKEKWRYRQLITLGHGVFGTVYSSMAANGETVAIKQVKIDPELQNRELEVLGKLHSPFCLTLIDYFYTSSPDQQTRYLNLVTEIMPESLGRLIRNAHVMKQPLAPFLTKLFIYELFAGLAHIHSLGIAHRDIKTDNCLVDLRKGLLKIIDFGSAKIMDKDEANASYIASRIYRAPELLLDCTTYDNKIDIWAAGCVAAEIILDAIPMFQGSCNEDHLVQIMHVIGQPTPDDEKSFEHPIPFPKVKQICTIENALPLSTDPELLKLLKRIFVYNPAKRPTAVECCQSPYFNELFEEGVKLPNGHDLPELPRF